MGRRDAKENWHGPVEVLESHGVTQQAGGSFFPSEVQWESVEKGGGMVQVTSWPM